MWVHVRQLDYNWVPWNKWLPPILISFSIATLEPQNLDQLHEIHTDHAVSARICMWKPPSADHVLVDVTYYYLLYCYLLHVYSLLGSIYNSNDYNLLSPSSTWNWPIALFLVIHSTHTHTLFPPLFGNERAGKSITWTNIYSARNETINYRKLIDLPGDAGRRYFLRHFSALTDWIAATEPNKILAVTYLIRVIEPLIKKWTN